MISLGPDKGEFGSRASVQFVISLREMIPFSVTQGTLHTNPRGRYFIHSCVVWPMPLSPSKSVLCTLSPLMVQVYTFTKQGAIWSNLRVMQVYILVSGAQMRYLGLKRVSCLWRCPQFRGVLIVEFHCIYIWERSSSKKICM